MFNSIMTWITANIDSIITGIVIELVVVGLFKIWVLTKKIPKAITKLRKVMGMKYLEFILLYALPLGTITWMIIDNTNEPTFRTIALFIFICISFVFNILMNHVIKIYSMISELTSKSSYNDKTHKKAINLLFEKINMSERID